MYKRQQLTQSKADAIIMNTQLQQTKEHSAKLAGALDALRADSAKSVTELQEALHRAHQDVEALKHHMYQKKEKSLVDMKATEPGKFSGKDAEDIKPWAKAVKSS